MPKGKGNGGKKRRRGKNSHEGVKRDLIVKERDQEYAQVLKMLGHGRLEAYCFDGKKRLCHIRGTIRKRMWIQMGDIILISVRDFQEEKGDVILKYSPDEARQLRSKGHLPENIKINENEPAFDSDDDDEIDFQVDVAADL
eukprot:Trichotokara_eunicae@DN5598_c0_g1_i2.p1